MRTKAENNNSKAKKSASCCSELVGVVPISISRKVQRFLSGRPRETKYSSRLPANTLTGTVSSYLKDPSLSSQAAPIAAILSLVWGEHAVRRHVQVLLTWIIAYTNFRMEVMQHHHRYSSLTPLRGIIWLFSIGFFINPDIRLQMRGSILVSRARSQGKASYSNSLLAETPSKSICFVLTFAL